MTVSRPAIRIPKAAKPALQSTVSHTPSQPEVFVELLGDVVHEVRPLQPSNKAKHLKAKPKPQPLQRIKDEQAALQESWSDEFDPLDLLETDENLSYTREGMGPDVLHKLRKGFWSVGDSLDLHGLRSEEARQALADFLRRAEQRNIRCLRIVHGKGHGSKDRIPILKIRVRRWLKQKREVLAYVQAMPADGGAGALLVLLG